MKSALQKSHERAHGINDWKTAVGFMCMILAVFLVFGAMYVVIKANEPKIGTVGNMWEGR